MWLQIKYGFHIECIHLFKNTETLYMSYYSLYFYGCPWKTEFFAKRYLSETKRKSTKTITRNDVFHVKTSQSAKHLLHPAKNENRLKKRSICLFCTKAFSYFIQWELCSLKSKIVKENIKIQPQTGASILSSCDARLVGDHVLERPRWSFECK